MTNELGYDDIEDLEAEEVEATRSENSTIRRIRQAQKEAVARAKKAEAEVRLLQQELAEQVSVNAKADVLNLFRSAGVPVEFGEDAWRMGLHTVDEAAAWAIDRGILKDESQPDLLPMQRQVEGFVPATGPGGVAQDTKVSKQEFTAMYANPATRPQAEALFLKGRVEGMEPPR